MHSLWHHLALQMNCPTISHARWSIRNSPIFPLLISPLWVIECSLGTIPMFSSSSAIYLMVSTSRSLVHGIKWRTYPYWSAVIDLRDSKFSFVVAQQWFYKFIIFICINCYSFVKQRSLLPTEAVWFQKHNFFQIDRIIANLSPFKLLTVKSWFGLTVSSNSDQYIFFSVFEHSWRIMGFHFIVTNSILSDVQIVISLASWSFKKLASIPFDNIPLICESCFCSSFVPSLPYTRNQIHLKGSWLPLGEQWN